MDTTVLFRMPAIVRAPRREPGTPIQRRAQRKISDREYRRALRAAEQAAWEGADPRRITRVHRYASSDHHAEDLLFGVIGTAIISALAFGAVDFARWVPHWDRVWSVLGSLVR